MNDLWGRCQLVKLVREPVGVKPWAFSRFILEQLVVQSPSFVQNTHLL